MYSFIPEQIIYNKNRIYAESEKLVYQSGLNKFFYFSLSYLDFFLFCST